MLASALQERRLRLAGHWCHPDALTLFVSGESLVDPVMETSFKQMAWGIYLSQNDLRVLC